MKRFRAILRMVAAAAFAKSVTVALSAGAAFAKLVAVRAGAAFAMVAAVALAGCADDGGVDPSQEPMPVAEQQRIHNAWRVDMIIGDSAHEEMLAEYSYDAEGRLVKANLSERFKTKNVGSRIEEAFVWEEGRIARQLTHMQYEVHIPSETAERAFETVYEYDDRGNLLHWNDNNWPGRRQYEYDDRGQLVQTYRYEFGGMIYSDRLEWDDRGNVVRHICEGPESNMFEQPIPGSLREWVYEYEYDNNPKPNFGVGDSFFWDGRYSPWPYAGNTDEQLARTLSRNNLTRCERAGYGYRYTYNDEGLPVTVEPYWIGGTRLNWVVGMNTLQTIVYKPVSP